MANRSRSNYKHQSIHRLQSLQKQHESRSKSNGVFTSFEQFRKKQKELAQKMEDFSGLDKALIIKIIQYAQTLRTPGTDVINEQVFKAQMLHRFNVTSHTFLQLVYNYSIKTASQPGRLRAEDYAKLMCLFYSSNFDHKIEFVFNVYDIDRDGEITAKELHTLLKETLVAISDEDKEYENEEEDPLSDMVTFVLKVLDINNDGHISLEEFRKYAKENVLFVELLGQVLPLDTHLHQFMETLRAMSDSYLREFFRHERSRCLHQPIMCTTIEDKRRWYPVTLDYVDFV